MKKNSDLISFSRKLRNLQSLSFVKATAWVILGISSMFSANDLTSTQNEELWLSTLTRFGLAIGFLLAGIFLKKDHKNIYLLLIVVLIDLIVSIQKPIGLFDSLMILFDIVFYWIIFNFLKKAKL
ncbi:MAG: hypothetical protein CVU41_17915 [Chloroflexi bacterium HGW-Chloroflexi-3]|nr:MAG: hypothetical protein CVU41_17915 [Chloroflexi bacterium HGW-Chloroflexi-3]